MYTKLLDCLCTIRSFRNQHHARFCVEQSCYALAEKGVVIDGQDANHVRFVRHCVLRGREVGIDALSAPSHMRLLPESVTQFLYRLQPRSRNSIAIRFSPPAPGSLADPNVPDGRYR